MWIVIPDYVLRIELPQQATLIGYVDDIPVVVADKYLEDVIWAQDSG